MSPLCVAGWFRLKKPETRKTARTRQLNDFFCSMYYTEVCTARASRIFSLFSTCGEGEKVSGLMLILQQPNKDLDPILASDYGLSPHCGMKGLQRLTRITRIKDCTYTPVITNSPASSTCIFFLPSKTLQVFHSILLRWNSPHPGNVIL